MNLTQSPQSKQQPEAQAAVVLKQPTSKIHPPEKQPLTFGQKLADKMASKVGSWAFLIGQSTVLVGWITFNSIPGLPHFDEQPFILLNLMFSFASAYTAPVVLMSQNRQSEEDRENANHNYQVTLQAAQQLELLHEKLDAEYSKKLDELTTLIKQQQGTGEAKVVFVPTHVYKDLTAQSNESDIAEIFNSHSKDTVFVNVSNSQSVPAHINFEDVQVLINK